MKTLLFLLLVTTASYGQTDTVNYNIYGNGSQTLWKFPVDSGYHGCTCLLLTPATGSAGLAVSPAIRLSNLRISDRNISYVDTVDIEMYNIFNVGVPPYPLRVVNRPAGYHIEVECILTR